MIDYRHPSADREENDEIPGKPFTSGFSFEDPDSADDYQQTVADDELDIDIEQESADEEASPPEGEDAIEWYYRWGKQKVEANQLNEAIEAYRQVLILDAMHIKARNNLALIYDSMGLFEKAVEELRTALELDGRDVEVRANLGALLGEHGRIDDAEKEFRRALEIAPEDPRIRFNLGLTYFRKGLYSKATHEFERAISYEADHKQALYYLAQSYNLTGQYAKSLKLFEQLIEMEPENHRAHWYLGMLYDRLKDHELARQYYQNSYRIRQSLTEKEKD